MRSRLCRPEHALPRYFFTVRDGRDLPDLDGTELPDLAAVRTEAVRYAGELLRDGVGEFWSGHEWRMEVTDVTGACAVTLRFSAEEHGSPG